MYLVKYLKKNDTRKMTPDLQSEPPTTITQEKSNFQNLQKVESPNQINFFQPPGKNYDHLIPEVTNFIQNFSNLYSANSSQKNSFHPENKIKESKSDAAYKIQTENTNIDQEKIQEYCHSYDTDKCMRGKLCPYIHNTKPLGACIRIHCGLCELEDLLIYCDGENHDSNCNKEHPICSHVNQEISDAKRALEENIKTIISEKYKLRELISERNEAKDA